MREGFKETDMGVYLKELNSLIHSTNFKPLLLILIFQCGINPPLFLILSILTHKMTNYNF